MTINAAVRLAVASALAISAASAVAASDYLLEIKGVAGEAGATDTSQTIEISSFSWGASNPTSVGSSGLSAGKASMQDMTVTAAGSQAATAQAVRESPTKVSTGKTAAAAAGSPVGATAAPKVGDMATVTVFFRESPTKSSTGKAGTACTKGEHIKEAVLTAQGQRYEMHDVVVSGCPVGADGRRGKELTGHVTLIK
jgi:type VI protein secretion system component Hcp